MATSKRPRLKLWLKANRKSSNFFLRSGIGIFDTGVSLIRRGKGLLLSRNDRAILGMKLFHSGRTHQTTPATYPNRFPEIFRTCQDYFKGQENLHILSFGCSTGEEVVTLRCYFPNARITGAEINCHCLKQCQRLKLDEQMQFIYSSPQLLLQHGPYDAIFCMAVFQRTPELVMERQIRNLSRIYPFEKFQRQVRELDGYLKPGGLLVIHYSQYAFQDTDIAKNYRPWSHCNQDAYCPFPVFDARGIQKPDGHGIFSIHIKNK